MDEIKAEREEVRRAAKATRTKHEPRLAYEIALGIIIGGVTLWILKTAINMVGAYLVLKGIKIHFGL